MRSLNALWRTLGGIDLRTLAVFRIMLAACCITECLILWPDAYAFLDDRGIFPRKEMLAWQHYSWSLYYISGHVLWAHTLLGLTILCSLAMMVGYRTRLATGVNWILVVSLINRIPIYTSGAHMQLPILLFWAMFLPLGAAFSVDAALHKPAAGNPIYISCATLAVLVQEIYLYLFGALLKTGASWHGPYDAIYYVTHESSVVSPLGAYLGQFLELTRVLTVYVYHLELLAVLLLFSPWKTQLCRLLVLPLLLTLHMGFAIFMSIGFFPMVSITGLTLFIPPLFWDKALPWFNRRPARQHSTLYYDEACGICRKFCRILRALGMPPDTAVEPAQHHPEIYAIMQRDGSVLAEDGAGQRRTGWDAVAWCCRRSPLLWPLGVIFLPSFMHPAGEWLYRAIAPNRQARERWAARFLPESETSLVAPPHMTEQAAAVILAVIILIWNIGHLPGRELGSLSVPLANILKTFHLEQSWRFFAPMPNRITRWVVVEGHLSDGRRVDAMRDRMTPPSYAKPADGYEISPNHHWQKFYGRVQWNKEQQQRTGHYYCELWRENHPDLPLTELVFTLQKQIAPAPGEEAKPAQRIVGFTYSCPAP